MSTARLSRVTSMSPHRDLLTHLAVAVLLMLLAENLLMTQTIYRCIGFDPLQYPTITFAARCLKYSSATIPFVHATTARKSAAEGLINLAKELDVFAPTTLSEGEIRSLAQQCVTIPHQTRDRVQPAPTFKAIITSKDIHAAATVLSNDLVMPCERTLA